MSKSGSCVLSICGVRLSLKAILKALFFMLLQVWNQLYQNTLVALCLHKVKARSLPSRCLFRENPRVY